MDTIKRTIGRVLVVDDDPAIRQGVAEALGRAGYAVETAQDGREALAALENDRPAPDVLLLDMRLPRLNGWVVARRLRARGCAIPIVVMSAAADAWEWAANLAAEDFLAKPFGVGSLYDVVGRFCPGVRPV